MLEVRDKVLKRDSFGPVLTIKAIGHWKTNNKFEVEFYEKSGTFSLDNYRKFIPEYTPENITSLKENEIFVFGSNTDGKHGAGAAKTAVEKFGAIYGKGVGLQGQSYAIPTLDYSRIESDEKNYSLNRSSLTDIQNHVKDLCDFARENYNLKFYMTKIGVGLAGFSMDEIQRVFLSCEIPVNIILPKDFEYRYE